MNNIIGSTVNVGKLLSSDFFFNIPYYQRPFAWDDDNFTSLIDDLIQATDDQFKSATEQKQYFLGTLVLHKLTTEGNDYDVVDGQQRLTSLIILTACIRDAIDDIKAKNSIQGKIIQEENIIDGIPSKPRIVVRSPSSFKYMVLNEGSTKNVSEQPNLTETDARYAKAITIFHSKLQDKSQEYLTQLIQFLSQRCLLIYLSTTSFDDAFKLFTITNDRGKQLRRIDILKAQNIQPNLSQKLRDHLAVEWESLENSLGEDTFESILHMMRLIYVQAKPNEDLYSEFEKRVFNKNIVEKGEFFINQLKSYSNLYQQIFIDRDYLSNIDSSVINNKFFAMISIMQQEFDAYEWKPCVLSYAKKFTTRGIYEFILLIEKLYLSDWTKGHKKDERINTYIRVLKLIDKESDYKKVLEAIADDLSKIQSSGFSKIQEIQTKIKSHNFYNTSYAKYFLLRLEVLASEHDVLKEYKAKSIEHILPQNPKDDSLWAKDPDFIDHGSVVNTIGNLILLSKGKNSSASNNDFEIKKKRYLKDRVSDYPRSVQVMAEDNWSIEKIKRNTDSIAGIILDAP